MVKKPIGTKRASLKAPRAAASKRAGPVTKKSPARDGRKTVPTVYVARVGGFQVFGSALRSLHVTEQQIDDAIAEIG